MKKTRTWIGRLLRRPPAPVELHLRLFDGFAAEWLEYSYSARVHRPLQQNTIVAIDRSAWDPNAFARFRTRAAGMITTRFPEYRVNAGLILAIRDLFMSCCLDPEFYPGVELPFSGTSRDLHSSPGGRFRDYGFLLQLRSNEEIQEFLDQTPPTTSRRYQLALLLMNAAYHWVLYHEESHYLGGHLAYCEILGARAELSEAMSRLPAPSLHAIDQRALELHADERAHASVARTYVAASALRWNPIESERNRTGMLRSVIIAIGAVQLLFALTQASCDHPDPLARLLDSVGLLVHLILTKQISPELESLSPEEIAYTFDRAIKDLQIVARVLRVEADLERMIAGWFAKSQSPDPIGSELIEINERLRELRPLLTALRQETLLGIVPIQSIDSW